MKILLCSLAVFLISIQFVYAQDRPLSQIAVDEFAGTWILDRDKSFSSREIRKNYRDYVLEIRCADQRLTLERNYVYEGKQNHFTINLYADGRKEKNLDMDGVTDRMEVESKTTWKKGKLSRSFDYTSSSAMFLPEKEVYSLSPDRKTLTIVKQLMPNTMSTLGKQAMSGPGSSGIEVRLVFNRKAE